MFVWFLFLIFSPTNAHVMLAFPEARWPGLNLWTKRVYGPCGVPRTFKSPSTTLKAGESYNITWVMQMIHNGGYTITLLDKEGKEVELLSDVTAQRSTDTAKMVTLPNKTCDKCSIQFFRQETETPPMLSDVDMTGWYSCADVDIVLQDPEKPCTKNGKMMDNGKCECNAGFTGDTCTIEEECATDENCSGGKCVDQGTAHDRFVCYCPPPTFGQNCGKSYSPNKDDEIEGCFNYAYPQNMTYSGLRVPHVLKYNFFNPHCYDVYSFNEDDYIYWRKVDEETMEVVVDFKTTGYVGVAWRLEDFGDFCKDFPFAFSDGWGIADPAKGWKPDEPPRDEEFKKSTRNWSRSPPCRDMVVSTVRDGQYVRIHDYYSKKGATPRKDTYYGFEDDLKAGYGIETGDGRSLVMFRKPVSKDEEKTDIAFGPGERRVLWGKSIEVADYEGYYETDLVQYHGLINRGHVFFSFFEEGDEAWITKYKRAVESDNKKCGPQPEPKDDGKMKDEKKDGKKKDDDKEKGAIHPCVSAVLLILCAFAIL